MLAKLEIVLAQGSKLPIAIQTALREFIGNNLQQVCCEQISLKWADRWRRSSPEVSVISSKLDPSSTAP
jgi:hypothetical protein